MCFWGLTLVDRNRYSQVVQRDFTVTGAVLEPYTTNDVKVHQSHVSVYVEINNLEFLICLLKRNAVPQTQLKLKFSKGEHVSFFTLGDGVVHLTGYHALPLDDQRLGRNDLSDRTPKRCDWLSKGVSPVDEPRDVGSSSSVGLDEIEGLYSDLTKEPTEIVGSSKSSSKIVYDLNYESRGGNKPKKQKRMTSDSGSTDGPIESQRRKLEVTPGSRKAGASSASSSSDWVELDDRLAYKDLKKGAGPVVKTGQTVHIYYKGRLAVDNKQFDSCMSGQPFTFKVGGGDVIAGLDTAVAGMAVGGKRRIKIPEKLGYGKKATLDIPSKSNLEFDVYMIRVD